MTAAMACPIGTIFAAGSVHITVLVPVRLTSAPELLDA